MITTPDPMINHERPTRPRRWTVVRGGAAILCAGLVFPISSPLTAAAAHPRWSIVPSPPQTAPQGQLNGVSCASSAHCVAVGSRVTEAGRGATLGERWSGSAWSRMDTADPSGSTDASLAAVSCAARTTCEAVGRQSNATGTTTLAEVWNGSNWSIQPTPNPTGTSYARLTSVSCSSASACMAIGSTGGGVGGPATFVETWDGSAWNIQTPYGSLSGVSCTSATACVAVGWAIDFGTGAQVTLAETWDGTFWTVQSTPNPADSTGAYLNAVSCSSALACTAVGNYSGSTGYAALSEVWDGSAWTIQYVPSPAAGSATLSGISCTAATACRAVGTAGGLAVVTLAEAWDGSAWTIQSTPNPAGFRALLNAVSCMSPVACKAVGSTDLSTKPSRYQTVAEAWDGIAWSIQPTPNQQGAVTSLLFGISCTSPSACIAVGGHSPLRGTFADRPGLTLAEIWNGASWSVQATANPHGASSANLSGISCASATDCVAVGTFNATTLAEMWNGAVWSIQSTPNPNGTGAQLSGVSCQSATACMAVGTATNSGTHAQAPLAERWNGTKWSIVPISSPAGATAQLSGISCSSATSCIAVGSATDQVTFATTTLAELWNGTAWTIQTTPNPASGYPQLSSISCSSATSCFAVGSATESWDGAVWSLQPSPAVANSSMNSVSCTAATTCIAAGTAPDAVTGIPSAFAAAWNGAAWTIQPTPSPAGAFANLSSVTCPSPNSCMSAGYYAFDVLVTLTERYS